MTSQTDAVVSCQPSQPAGTLRSCIAALGMILAMVVAMPAGADAQVRAPRRALPQADGVSPGEIQRLFDAYVVMQAQQELQLSDEQYPKFLAAVKSLQTARQRGLADRGRLLQALRRLDAAQSLDESQVRARMKELADLDARVAAEVRDAQAAIDQVLDLRQQVRFRLFEDQMERRKADLVIRARQARGQRQPVERP